MRRRSQRRRPASDVYLVPVAAKEALTLAAAADFLETMRSVGDLLGAAPAVDDCVQTLRDVANRYAAEVSGMTIDQVREAVQCR